MFPHVAALAVIGCKNIAADRANAAARFKFAIFRSSPCLVKIYVTPPHSKKSISFAQLFNGFRIFNW